MKDFLLLFFSLFFSINLFSQQVQECSDKPLSNEEIIINQHPEVPPEYPGGDIALLKDIQDSIQYPKIEGGVIYEPVIGIVYIQCNIDTSGNMVNIKVARGVDKYLDKEALRVIYSLKKWKPATLFGKPITFEYIIPVRFELN